MLAVVLLLTAAEIRNAPSVDPAKVPLAQSEYAAGRAFDTVADVATNAIEGRIKTVGTWHQYDPKRIDWKLNPVYNG